MVLRAWLGAPAPSGDKMETDKAASLAMRPGAGGARKALRVNWEGTRSCSGKAQTWAKSWHPGQGLGGGGWKGRSRLAS